jgi:hypothetical protein
MSNDLLNKPDQGTDPIQQNYSDDAIFSQLTNAEHMAKDGISQGGGAASPTKRGFFNRDGDKSSGDSAAGAAGAAAVGVAGLGAAEALGSKFNPIDSLSAVGGLKNALFGSARRKKSSIAGVTIGAVIGGSFFGFTIVSGPLQILHYAELMSRIHLTTHNNQSDDRTGKIFKTARNYKNQKVFRNNLGILGNNFADRISAKLKAAGYESSYHPRTGAFEGLRINTDEGPYKGKTEAEVREIVRQKFNGVELKKGSLSSFPGKESLYLDPRDMGYRKGIVETRGVIKVILTDTGSSGLAASIDSRVTGKRFGLTLHPFRRLDAKIIAAADRAIQAKKSAREQQAAEDQAINQETADNTYHGNTAEYQNSADSDNSPTKTEPEKQAQAEKNARAQQTKTAADSVVSEGQATDTAIINDEPGAISKFAGSLQGKATLGVAAIAGLACVARGIDAQASSIKEAQVNEPLMRLAVELQSSGSQTRSGQDTNPKQLRNYAYRLNGFSQSETFKAETGQPYDKTKVSETLKNINGSATPFHFLNEASANSILGPVCSSVGTGVLIAVSFLGGPLAAVAGLAGGLLFGPPIINALTHWLTGHAVNIADKGAELSNDIGYGTKLFANADSIAKAGSKLKPKKAAELSTQNKIAYQEQLNSESFFQKTFSPTNQSSVVSSLIDRTGALQTSSIGGTLSSLLSPKTYSGLFSTVLYQKAAADTFSESYDYGVDTYGFSADEMENAATSDPFANADNASTILDGKGSQANADRAAKYISRASKCYSANLTSTPSSQDPTVNVWSVMVDSSSNPNHNTNYYSDEYNNMSSECADSAPEWLSVRFLIFDTQTMKAVACDEGDDQTCAELGFSTSGKSDTTTAPASSTTADQATLYQDSTSVPCADGTMDAGIHTGYHDGSPVNIRLCALPNLPSQSAESRPGNSYSVPGANGLGLVNSRISGQFYALVTTAAKDNVTMRAESTYRTMDHQTALCNQNTRCSSGDYSKVANPGTSNHQMGLAIDFAKSDGVSGISRGDQWYNWLADNASNFGIKNYPVENYHWSPTGN